MADTKRKAGRPPKNTTPTVDETVTTTVEEPKVDATAELIKQLMAQIEEQNQKMAEMQEKIANGDSQQTSYTPSSNLESKKIKCISLMHNPMNVSTEPFGRGKLFEFDNYGATRLISFDDLSNIVSCYPNTCRQGCLYITDKDAVERLDLAEYYEKNVYSKEKMDDITAMRNELAGELFIGLGKDLRESTALAIAERINANEVVDYNALVRIKAETGIDISAIAESIKKPTKD